MSYQSKKILIIEDEKPMANAMGLKLNKSGFEAKMVFDGEAGLRILEKKKFDLIILDLIMPKINGFGVLEELNKRGDRTPVIVASNLSQEEDIKKAKELGAVDFFIKSNTPIKEIVDIVEKILG